MASGDGYPASRRPQDRWIQAKAGGSRAGPGGWAAQPPGVDRVWGDLPPRETGSLRRMAGTVRDWRRGYPVRRMPAAPTGQTAQTRAPPTGTCIPAALDRSNRPNPPRPPTGTGIPAALTGQSAQTRAPPTGTGTPAALTGQTAQTRAPAHRNVHSSRSHRSKRPNPRPANRNGAFQPLSTGQNAQTRGPPTGMSPPAGRPGPASREALPAARPSQPRGPPSREPRPPAGHRPPAGPGRPRGRPPARTG